MRSVPIGESATYRGAANAHNTTTNRARTNRRRGTVTSMTVVSSPLPSAPAPISPAVKPGWKTTEFGAYLVSTILVTLYMSGIMTSDRAMAIAGAASSVLAALGYKASRTLVKRAASQSGSPYLEQMLGIAQSYIQQHFAAGIAGIARPAPPAHDADEDPEFGIPRA